MSDSTEDPDKTLTTSEEQAAKEGKEGKEGKELAQGGVRVGVISILSLLLIVIGLLQATGVIDLFPFGSGWTVQWSIFILLAFVLIGIEVWGWKS